MSTSISKSCLSGVALLLCVLGSAACSPVSSSKDDDRSTQTPATSATSASQEKAQADSAVQWLGWWAGPEGTFLQIMPAAQSGHFELTLKDNLDSQAKYDAVAKNGALYFTRDGKQEDIRPGTGDETGFSDLFGLKDCLVIVKNKEGYCHRPGAANFIPLKRGTYVTDSASCKNPALADIQVFDGAGFSGAHSHDCKATVRQQNGLMFVVENTCVGAGTGDAPKWTERDTIIVQDDEHYQKKVSDDTSPTALKYCPADQLPPSLRSPAG